ncbi:MAG: hypothetical protein JXC31_03835, partial [Acholeplasmataceae bacterium]|nr:hypothetical protein [Acholeplasmataceae bacterium]
MRDKNKFKKQFQKKSRLEILKSWMTSFVITTAAVVVTVVAIPSSPKASINQLQIFQDQIVYQVEITDSDNAIQSNSLEIILENQFEHYAIDLDLGVNIGSFTELTEDTTYQLYVMGDKGFGNEKLASKTITTKPSSGGAILSYELLESSVHYNPIYDLGIIVRDQLNLYNLVTLYYGVIGYDETEPFEYYSFDIADGESTITLDQIYQSNAQVHVYLEATLENNEIIILDELYFYTPINFELYYSVEQVTESAIKVSFYPEFYQLSDLEYEFKLKKDGLVVSTKTFDSHDIQDETM